MDLDDWLELSESEKLRCFFKLYGIKVLLSGVVNCDVFRIFNEMLDINIIEFVLR